MAVNILKVLPHHLLAGSVLLWAASHCQAFAQSPECPTGEALLSASDPVYADALELAQSLHDHGFVVRCMFPTKLGSIFRVAEGGVEHSTIEGEAAFRTNYGDIDAVFVPKPQTFADFKITEHREDGGYLYTFAGSRLGSQQVWERSSGLLPETRQPAFAREQ